MNLEQPLMAVASALASVGLCGAATSAWRWHKLQRAHALIQQLEVARRQLAEQVSHARRQIEQLQPELVELRQTVEHLRRKEQLAAARREVEAWSTSSWAPISSHAPLMEIPAPESRPAASGADRAGADRAGADRARAVVAAADFAPTQVDEDEDDVPFGFLPTQIDPPY